MATSSTVVKYAGPSSSQAEFVPFAVEFQCPINSDAPQFFSELCGRLVETTGEFGASSFIFLQISVAVQRFYSVPLHDGFIDNR